MPAERPDNKRCHTSGEAARLCGLAVTTLKRWIRRGVLQAYKTPGGDYRILHESLLDFMREFEIPMHHLERPDGPVLLLALASAERRRAMRQEAEALDETIRVREAADEMALGYELASTRPAFLVLEERPEAGPERYAAIRRALRPHAVRIGLLRADAAPPAIPGAGAEGPNVAMQPRADTAWIRDFLCDLLGRMRPVATIAKTARRAG